MNKFERLGYAETNSPGEVLDKAARSMRLHQINRDFLEMSGGQALETIAKGGDPLRYEMPNPRSRYRAVKNVHIDIKGRIN